MMINVDHLCKNKSKAANELFFIQNFDYEKMKFEKRTSLRAID